MKKTMKTLTTFLAGALCAVMVISVTVPSFAADVWKTISVRTGINVYVDDIKINPTDVNGKPVDVLLHDGTTYLPVRAVSRALGQNITWDGKTQSVFVGKHAADNQPAFPLYDLDYFTTSGTFSKIDNWTEKDNIGVNHDATAICVPNLGMWGDYPSVTYKLNGQYSALTGVYFLPYDIRNTEYKASASVYGDGRLLWKGEVTGGVEPIPFNIDLKGIMTMEIKCEFERGYYGYKETNFGLFGDTMLYT